MRGIVIKSIAGSFTVKTAEGEFVATARGKLKRDFEILAGDNVELNFSDKVCVIEKVLKRKNFLIRPPVANIDHIVIVISNSPEPDFILVDKIIINSVDLGLDVTLVINKNDIATKEFIDNVYDDYRNAVDSIIDISCLTGDGRDKLADALRGKISALAGQSAVGKSSMTNMIFVNESMLTGEMSQKSKRGKHTTRHSELLIIDDNSYLIDTPGFTFFDAFTENITYQTLQSYYLDFEGCMDRCRFKGCSHTVEPDCAVRDAAMKGELSKRRYDRYCAIHAELKEKWEKRY